MLRLDWSGLMQGPQVTQLPFLMENCAQEGALSVRAPPQHLKFASVIRHVCAIQYSWHADVQALLYAKLMSPHIRLLQHTSTSHTMLPGIAAWPVYLQHGLEEVLRRSAAIMYEVLQICLIGIHIHIAKRAHNYPRHCPPNAGNA